MRLPLSLRRWIGTTTLIAAALGSGLAHGAVGIGTSFTDLVFFGDSLSDSGNLYRATGGALPGSAQPYATGRYSDGPVWTEQFATLMGMPGKADPYLSNAFVAAPVGNNYAYAGARTGLDASPPGVLAQVAGIWGANPLTMADPNALYVVVGGGNDMRDARSAVGADNSTRQAAAEAAVNTLGQSLAFLASRGAKNILISNLPNLANTPEALFMGPAIVASSLDASNRFNALIPGLMGYGQTVLGLNMFMMDMAGISTLGLTNTTMPCGGFFGSAGAACADSLFSDALHPSTAGHALIAQAAFNAVTAVPEPQTVALMLLGLGLVGAAVRRRAAVPAVPA